MKKKIDVLIHILMLLMVLTLYIGPAKIMNTVLRIYNDTQVDKKDFIVELPNNWAVFSERGRDTRIIGYSESGADSNTFKVDLYESGIPDNYFLAKWTKCKQRTWIPLETNEGKGLALHICSYDLNTTTNEKPSLLLTDGNYSAIASVYEWKPYYNEEYLKVFKSIKIKEGASIIELETKPAQ